MNSGPREEALGFLANGVHAVSLRTHEGIHDQNIGVVVGSGKKQINKMLAHLVGVRPGIEIGMHSHTGLSVKALCRAIKEDLGKAVSVDMHPTDALGKRLGKGAALLARIGVRKAAGIMVKAG